MPHYMLLMYHPVEEDQGRREGEVPQEQFAEEHQRWQKLVQDLKGAGVLVSNSGLAGVEAATTVRVRDGETQITDGPFAETKEILAGYFLIEADDLDAALGWAARIPSAEWGSVEVRPTWG